MSSISALVLTLNEAAHIVPCLRALRWADETVVLDAGSSDGTPELAAALGARVAAHPFDQWAAQRNRALALAGGEWAFFVDADERVPLELAAEIRERVAEADARRAAGDPAAPVGFWVPRQNVIVGQWVRYAGWYPDYQLRLFRRERGRYDPGRPVHELVVLDGPSACLEHLLVHQNYAAWGQFWEKQRRYARWEARALFDRRIRPRPRNFILQPLREFRRRYLDLEGYRGGARGALLSAAMAYFTLVTYLELWRLWRAEPAGR